MCTCVQVAAGLTTTFTIEIYAIAAGIEGAVGVAKISHSVTIVTETDILSLPVTANILDCIVIAYCC